MKNRTILTPYFIDQPEPGLAMLAGPDWQINSIPLPSGRKLERLVTLYQSLVDFVADTLEAGERPVSVAGDCVTSLAVLAGLQRAGISPTLIWLDAHGDFNTCKTTPSGFLGGMPLAMAVGRGEQTIVEGVGLAPIPEEKVILSDARDLDPGEQEAVAGSRVTHVADAEELLSFDLPAGPLYVHFDTDILDPADAPAMNYPAPGGPALGVMRRLFKRLATSEQVVAVSVSSWAPELDEDGRTRQTVMELLQALIA